MWVQMTVAEASCRRSLGQKISAAIVGVLLAGSVVIIAVSVAIGRLQGETLGYFAFSLLLAGAGVDFAVLIAQTTRSLQKVSKLLWLGLCALVLAFELALGCVNPEPMEGKGFVVGYSMMVLSFPLGGSV